MKSPYIPKKVRNSNDKLIGDGENFLSALLIEKQKIPKSKESSIKNWDE